MQMIGRVMAGMIRVLTWVGMLAVILMMLQITIDVAGKYLFNAPIPATISMVSNYYMVVVAFIPIAYVETRNEHITVEVVTEFLPYGFAIQSLSPALAAVIFGALVGLGLLAMFRHNGSLGGLGVVALLVQDTTGFKAGWVQLITDAVIFSVALFLFPASVVGYSLLGALVLNLIITFNHRRDRYIAT